MPRFFAGDYLQRVPPDTRPGSHPSYREVPQLGLFVAYRYSTQVWPSLFVAAAGSRGGLHTDSFGSNFYQLAVRCKANVVFVVLPSHNLSISHTVHLSATVEAQCKLVQS